MAAIAFVLSGRDRSAGAALVVAIAVKFTAILLAPFVACVLDLIARVVPSVFRIKDFVREELLVDGERAAPLPVTVTAVPGALTLLG